MIQTYKTIRFEVAGNPYPMMEATPCLVRFKARDYLNITECSNVPRPYVGKERSDNLEPWVAAIIHAGQITKHRNNLLREKFKSVHLSVKFFHPRPQKHYKLAGALTESAELSLHSQWPNVIMLGRAVGEGLAGILYEDINSLRSVSFKKDWTDSGTERAEITVEALRKVRDKQPELELEI